LILRLFNSLLSMAEVLLGLGVVIIEKDEAENTRDKDV
jgi:hypothetical protein